MKSLKLNHAEAQLILSGQRHSTWRINDDKDLHVHDQVSLVDKVDSVDPSSWRTIGTAYITSILEKQLGSVRQQDLDQSEHLDPLTELLTTYRAYYGQQVNEETPVKIISFTFTRVDNGAVTEPEVSQELKLYCDGGSRGNPGPSACGFVLLDMNDQVLVENGLALGITTNNQAEYRSLKLGLEAALKQKATILHVYMDSMLVINQMKGLYKVKNHDLIAINTSVRDLVTRFSRVTFTHVPRERNRRADAMVNEVLDAIKTN